MLRNRGERHAYPTARACSPHILPLRRRRVPSCRLRVLLPARMDRRTSESKLLLGEEGDEQQQQGGLDLEKTDSYVAATQLYEVQDLLEEDEAEEEEEERGHEDTNNHYGNGSPGQHAANPAAPYGISASDVKGTAPGDEEGEIVVLKPYADPAENTDSTNPFVQANIFSRLNFSWISPLIHKGWKKPLEMTDVPALSWKMRTENVFIRFEQLWEEELRKKGPEKASLFWTMVKMYPWELVEQFVVMSLWIVAFVVTPVFFMRELIAFTSNDKSFGWGMFLVFGMMIAECMRSMTSHYYWHTGTVLAVKLQGLMYSLVYNKAIKLRDLSGYTVGELVNLATNDGQRVFDAATLCMFVYAAFMMGAVVVILAAILIGPFAILGFAIYIIMIPVQSFVARSAGRLRRRAVKFTDARVRLMNEILTCIRLIKMYAWEKPFSEHIDSIRLSERNIISTAAYIESIVVSLIPVAPVLASVITYSLTAVTGRDISSADAFTVMALFNLMRFTLSAVPRAVRAGSEAFVGFERLKKFLLLENRLRRLKAPLDSNAAVEIENGTFAWAAVKDMHSDAAEVNRTLSKMKRNNKDSGPSIVKRENLNGESADQKSSSKNSRKGGMGRRSGNDAPAKVPVSTPVLFNINIKVQKGELIGICGAVGSGKSSFVAAILGQMQVKAGHIRGLNDIAYVSQQAWIQNQTLKDNILFGQPFDEKLYHQVVEACCLTVDIEALPAKDETEIGERGITLSGGQKQRVSMARALYANKAMYILDDPLSAVDAHVGKQIFELCIKKLLKGKTVILVTHQLQYLPQCDRVLFFSQGRIDEMGEYETLLASNGGFSSLIRARQEEERAQREAEAEQERLTQEKLNAESGDVVGENADAPQPQDEKQVASEVAEQVGGGVGQATEAEGAVVPAHPVEEPASEEAKEAGKTLVVAEVRERGAVTWRTYRTYARLSGGIGISSVVLLFFVLSTVAKWFSDWWLSYWLEKGDGRPRVGKDVGNITENPDLNFYAGIYGLSAGIIIVLQVIRSYLFNKSVLSTSSKMHRRLLQRVIHAPMSFFDTTPTGRVLNRFSKDMDEVDSQLPRTLEMFIQNSCLILLGMATVASVLPYFLIALVPIMAFYYFIVRYFRPTQRELKRIDNICRSPLLSHLTVTLQGLPTLHAFSKEPSFLNRFHALLNDNNRVVLAFWTASRWFAYRVDFVTVFMSFATSMCVVTLRDSIDPGSAGLALLYVTSLGGMFQFTTRLSAEAEARFTSVERITGYMEDLPIEGDDGLGHEKPLEPWPVEGGIDIKDLVVRYRPKLPPVLKSISLQIKPCEKIGIAGRTGSGKSTLMTCLFRLMEPASGSISIDGVDISTLDLEALRSKLAIIPQDPVLFVGTVRFNLDPFNSHTDDAIWGALERAHIKAAISALPAGLESPVVENGENFSVGERQLMCLARALLRDTKILVLDEATSAADAKTDLCIQRTIRESFAGKRTLLTIAHRLDTILDSDRILVLDAGRVAEFAPPAELLANPRSMFSKMLRATQEAAQGM